MDDIYIHKCIKCYDISDYLIDRKKCKNTYCYNCNFYSGEHICK